MSADRPAKTREEFEAFLVELEALYVKHGIALGSCGCCGGVTPTIPSYEGAVGDWIEEVRSNWSE